MYSNRLISATATIKGFYPYNYVLFPNLDDLQNLSSQNMKIDSDRFMEIITIIDGEEKRLIVTLQRAILFANANTGRFGIGSEVEVDYRITENGDMTLLNIKLVKNIDGMPSENEDVISRSESKKNEEPKIKKEDFIIQNELKGSQIESGNDEKGTSEKRIFDIKRKSIIFPSTDQLDNDDEYEKSINHELNELPTNSKSVMDYINAKSGEDDWTEFIVNNTRHAKNAIVSTISKTITSDKFNSVKNFNQITDLKNDDSQKVVEAAKHPEKKTL